MLHWIQHSQVKTWSSLVVQQPFQKHQLLWMDLFSYLSTLTVNNSIVEVMGFLDIIHHSDSFKT
jgi:hypothetical protein